MIYMRLKEALLHSLEKLNKPVNYLDVYEYIKINNLVDFSNSKTPDATISALLSGFIKNNDNRIKRTKSENGKYLYYLSKQENSFDFQNIENFNFKEKSKQIDKQKKYEERDLHILLSSYLKSKYIYSKTIYHEQSNRNDENQKWTHPDIVGIKFLKLQTNSGQLFLKSINKLDTFKISSYEIKKEIKNDYELKKFYFQAVSNSSWANFGYLVAFEINENLYEEIERLNQSFGIGVILLKSNPFESKVLYQPTLKELEFKTIDKLCKINSDFSIFIESIEKFINAGEKYTDAIEKEIQQNCDKYFENDIDFENYCREKNIPIDLEN